MLCGIGSHEVMMCSFFLYTAFSKQGNTQLHDSVQKISKSDQVHSSTWKVARAGSLLYVQHELRRGAR